MNAHNLYVGKRNTAIIYQILKETRSKFTCFYGTWNELKFTAEDIDGRK